MALMSSGQRLKTRDRLNGVEQLIWIARREKCSSAGWHNASEQLRFESQLFTCVMPSRRRTLFSPRDPNQLFHPIEPVSCLQSLPRTHQSHRESRIVLSDLGSRKYAGTQLTPRVRPARIEKRPRDLELFLWPL